MIANIGVIAGIFFLAYEVRQNTVSNQLLATQNFYTSWREIELFLAGNAEFAELHQRSIDGDTLTPAEGRRIYMFYRTRLREWDNAIFQLSQAGFDNDFAERQRETVRGIAREDELSVRIWRNLRDRFSPEFNALMESALEESASAD
jgi:hypothetical protein